MAISASYIWTRGIGLFTQRDLNLGQPTSQSYTYIIQDAAGNNVGTYSTPLFLFANKPDPRYGKILQVENGGQSWYNALALQLTKRFTHGFQAQVNYTWSHAIDDGNEQGASWNVASSFNNATFNGNYALDKGSSTLDQRHRVSINWLWSPTFTKSTSAFRQVPVERLGTLRHYHAGFRPPDFGYRQRRQHFHRRRIPGNQPLLRHAQRLRRLEARSVLAV